MAQQPSLKDLQFAATTLFNQLSKPVQDKLLQLKKEQSKHHPVESYSILIGEICRSVDDRIADDKHKELQDKIDAGG